MALGIRAQGEGTDVNGNLYRIRIWEDNYFGLVLDLELAQNFLVITYEPDADDLSATIIPSNAEVIVFDRGDVGLLLEDVLSKQQSTFYLTVEQQLTTDANYSPYWKGVILQDQIEFVEQSKPSLVLLRAIDGIALLEAREFKPNNNHNLTGGITASTLSEIILKCLNFGLPKDLWTANEPYLWTTINWWAEAQTYGALDDPLDTLLIDEVAWSEVVSKFNVSVFQNIKAFEVLQIIAKAFLGRVYMAKGRYIIEQLSERGNPNVKRYTYDKDGVGIKPSNLISQNIELNRQRGQVRMRDNIYTQFPALKRVSASQRTFNDNIIPNILLTASVPSLSWTKDFGLYNNFLQSALPVRIPQSFELTISFNVSFEIQGVGNYYFRVEPNTGARLVWARARVELEIKLLDAGSSDEYYYSSSGLWLKNQPTTIDVATPSLSGVVTNAAALFLPRTNFSSKNVITLMTNPIPVSGRVIISMGNYRLDLATGAFPFTWFNLNTSFINSATGWVRLDFKTTYATGQNAQFAQTVNNKSGVSDNQELDYGEIEIATGGTETGNLIVDPDGTRTSGVPAINWNYGNKDEDLSFINLLIRERLALQNDVLEVYDGAIQMPLGYNIAIAFDNKRYIPISYQFDAFNSLVKGQYALVRRFENNITIEPGGPGLTNLNAGVGTFSNKVANVNGVPISNAGFGFFLTTQPVPEANLPVKFNKGLASPVRSITASNGTSADLLTNEMVVYLTWSGVDGTFDLNLADIDPTMMDGMVLKIVLNKNFTANQNVRINAGDSDTIRGENNYIINGDNSKFVYEFWVVGLDWIGG